MLGVVVKRRLIALRGITMAAYSIARVDVRDWDANREYIRHTPRVIQKFGGRFIARGGEAVKLEGPEETPRLVLIIEQAKSF